MEIEIAKMAMQLTSSSTFQVTRGEVTHQKPFQLRSIFGWRKYATGNRASRIKLSGGLKPEPGRNRPIWPCHGQVTAWDLRYGGYPASDGLRQVGFFVAWMYLSRDIIIIVIMILIIMILTIVLLLLLIIIIVIVIEAVETIVIVREISKSKSM